MESRFAGVALKPECQKHETLLNAINVASTIIYLAMPKDAVISQR
jgi:hypothetical protein